MLKIIIINFKHGVELEFLNARIESLWIEIILSTEMPCPLHNLQIAELRSFLWLGYMEEGLTYANAEDKKFVVLGNVNID